MKRYMMFLSGLSCCLLALDFAMGVAGKKIIDTFNEIYNGPSSLMNYNINKVDSDILILGSSSATCHYMPSIIGDSLSKYSGRQISCFNAGAAYQNIPYCKAILKNAVSRSVPKIVILDLKPQHLQQDFTISQQVALRPYYHNNKYIKEIFDKYADPVERIKLCSNFYCNNRELCKLMIAPITKPKGGDGYYLRVGSLKKKPKPKVLTDSLSINPDVLEDFIEIADICKKNHTELFVVISPTLDYHYSSQIFSQIERLCNNLDVKMLNFAEDDRFQKCDYFNDATHMNIDGAKKFSSALCSSLKQFIAEGDYVSSFVSAGGPVNQPSGTLRQD